MKFRELEYGYTLQTEKYICFFGKKSADLSLLQDKFPSFNFLFLKQTHSNTVCAASTETQEGDSHWTQKQNQALVVKTADCTPILIYEAKSKAIAAVHAGWRGVENQILIKTLNTIMGFVREPEFNFFIGPHIQQSSFEVNEDVYLKLLASSKSRTAEQLAVQKDDKYFVNLKEILISQIDSVLGDNYRLMTLEGDTKTDSNFHSYRRDKDASGRNLSFITLL